MSIAMANQVAELERKVLALEDAVALLMAELRQPQKSRTLHLPKKDQDARAAV
jgi:hypothetical protein